MTERFSALLDDAVSEVQPRLADPVPVLIRRARAQRFKAAAAGALAVVALLGGGFAVSNELIAANQAQDAAGRSTEPPTPRVVDGKIVAGGLILPVPPGWKVVERKAAKSCGMLANTVLIGGPDDVGCATAPIEVSGTRGQFQAGEVTAISFARAEKGLLGQIAEHEQRGADAGIPPVLRGRIGPQAVAAWAELADELAVKRDIIRNVADIKLLRAGKGTRQPFGRHRLDWRWKFGPENDDAASS